MASSSKPVLTSLLALFASVVILLAGTALMALRNMEHADERFVSGGNGSPSAGPFDLVRKP